MLKFIANKEAFFTVEHRLTEHDLNHWKLLAENNSMTTFAYFARGMYNIPFTQITEFRKAILRS